MSQLSLFDNSFALAGVLPEVKAAMRRIVGVDDCRKAFVDKLNAVAAQAQIALTGGNVKSVSLDTLNKVLSPSDTSHPPSLLFILAFCNAASNYEPLNIIARAVGYELMTREDKMRIEIVKAEMEEKAAKKRKNSLKKLLEERM